MSDEPEIPNPWKAATDDFYAKVAARLKVAFTNLGPIAWAEGYARINRGEFPIGMTSRWDAFNQEAVFEWAGFEVLRIPRNDLVNQAVDGGA